MKIFFVTDAFAVWGGMERVLADKMNILARQYGWEVTLLTTNQGWVSDCIRSISFVDLGSC